jgi:hypothetical protein
MTKSRLTPQRSAHRIRRVPRLSTFARCAATVILLAIAWIDGAGLEFDARAMACCTHRHDCGGDLRAPDKCCEHMGHAAPAKTGTTVQIGQSAVLAPVALLSPIPTVELTPLVDRFGFTRPHDPPHLHTFALLI